MTEETTASQPNIVAEVTVQTGAVLALTKQNAVFRNGRQLVIPHHGAQFMQELMEALTSEEFVGAIVDNDAAEKDAQALADAAGAQMYCGHYGVDVMATCNDVEGHEGPHTYTEENGGVTAWHDHLLEVVQADLAVGAKEVCNEEHPLGLANCLDFAGHTGPHQGWQGGPADWGGGDDITWAKEPEVTPSRDVPEETTWEGFTIQHRGQASMATVFHPKSTKRLTFIDRDNAVSLLTDPMLDFYDRLCGQGYIEWFDIYFPGQEDWRRWKAGDALISDQGTRALVVPASEGLALINSEGNIFAVSDVNADIFSHWTVTTR